MRNSEKIKTLSLRESALSFSPSVRKIKKSFLSLFGKLSLFTDILPSCRRGFGLGGFLLLLLLELSLLLAAILGLTLSARFLFLSHLDSSHVAGQSGLFISYALVQDLQSAALALCGAFFIGLLCGFSPRLRLSLWSFYLFLLGLAYVINLKYYSLYAENFSWSHIKKSEFLNPELWYSFWMELDYKTALEIFCLGLFCLLWFRIGLRLILRMSPFFFQSRTFFGRQALARLGLLCLSLFFLFARARSTPAKSPLDADKNKSYIERVQILRDKVRFSNFLWQLAFPHKEQLQFEEGYELLSLENNYDHYRSPPFRFGFDSRSQENPEPRKAKAFVPKRKYNIVLYIFESTAHSYLKRKWKGSVPITPGWQQLSQNAVVFENHYAHSPLSANSLFSLLLSAYSMPADIWAIQKYPQIKIPSLAQILKRAAYRTAFMHTGRLSYVGQDKFLANRGFDLLHDMRHLGRAPYKKTLNWGIDDRALISAAREFAESSKQEPYFLLLSPMSPHHPYEVPEEKFKLFKPPSSIEEDQTKIPALSILEKNWQLHPQKQNSFERYLNSLHYADSVLQELVYTLENLPGGENTLFFILADHGEAFGQHRGNFNHPFYLYEENVHVPFIIYNRKLFPKAILYKAISRHIDLLPTILDCLGLERERRHEGLSLFRRMPQQIASFYTSWRNHLAGLRDKRWKYIFDLKYGTEELYDLKKDPQERQNLAQTETAITQRYRRYLGRLHAYQRKYFETVLNQAIDWQEKTDKSAL